MRAEVHNLTTRHARFGDQLLLQFKLAMIGCDAYAHVPEFFSGCEATLRANSIGVVLTWRTRAATNFAGGIHLVLALHRADDFGDGEIEFGQLVRLHPNAHRILTRAED